MDIELPGATFELLVEYGKYMKPVVFTINKFGVSWLCPSVCGCCEVHTMSVFVEC